jgi:hypothetical protein
MKITVAFKRVNPDAKQEDVGTIVYDGKKITVHGTDAENSDELRRLAFEEPVYLPVEGKPMRDLYSAEDPELFMRTLSLHYKSPYFFAEKPIIEK